MILLGELRNLAGRVVIAFCAKIIVHQGSINKLPFSQKANVEMKINWTEIDVPSRVSKQQQCNCEKDNARLKLEIAFLQ